MNQALDSVTNPNNLYSRSEIFDDECPVPREPGIYAWYFTDTLPLVPTHDCVSYNNKSLLYLGISPRRPPRKGKKSSQNLRKRIKYHYNGNAYGSTLRKTLGCLHKHQSGIWYITRGKDRGLAFTKTSEDKLSKWMEENASVTWETHDQPWSIEKEALKTLSLPPKHTGQLQPPLLLHPDENPKNSPEKSKDENNAKKAKELTRFSRRLNPI
jgi:hypothetical protein